MLKTILEKYVIKHKLTDFYVEEIPVITPKIEGKYCVFWLEKKDQTTFNAIKIISRNIKIPIKLIGYAGLKDRHAITKQLCSVPVGFASKLKLFSHKDIKIFILGGSEEPVFLGQLKGNYFKIIVRNILHLPEKRDSFINYYGEQRFGNYNHLIGRALIQKNFSEAVRLIQQKNSITSQKLTDFLEKYPGQFVNTLQKIPKNELLILVNAYQSYVWNQCVNDWIKKNKPTIESTFPLVGFGTELSSQQNSIVQLIFDKDNINIQSFVIREIPVISLIGGERKILAYASKIKLSKLEPDEEFQGKNKFTIEFILEPGCYATEYMRQLF
ncbi:tRNA pseudouridine(13) synthase TruD [Candidatus Woesearchaeota archaeon]|nr:tRNA pseudouridine(13) synthase TruD [Candidatus Woesearchaeota archaeon]